MITTEGAKEKRRKSGMPEPAPDQVWEECDPRSRGRRVRITDVRDETGFVSVRAIDTNRESRISIARLVPNRTGYKYIGMVSDLA